MQIELIVSEKVADFKNAVNDFLQSIPEENVISIQYATTPTAIATHTEYGVYPSVEYSAMIQYKK